MKPIHECAQTIDDIIFGFRTPADNSSRVEFYRRSEPQNVLVSARVNHRATFRWVATAPGREIRIDPSDRLEWRVVDTVIGRNSIHDLDWFDDLDVYVLGSDQETGEAIVQQSRWLNAGRLADSPIRDLVSASSRVN